MRTLVGFSFGLLVGVFALYVPVCSQTAKRAAPLKAVIDIDAFYDETTGIKMFSNALRPLDNEIKPFNDDIKDHAKKYNELANRAHRVPQEVDIKKIADEMLNEQLLIRGMQANAKDFYYKRRDELVKPFEPQVNAALKEFASSRGYKLILDKSKLDGSTVYADSRELADVTSDFIKFFNDKYSPKQN
ncbi:MAG: OmpH family outer membrane protein [Acidobacteriota bacterium]